MGILIRTTNDDGYKLTSVFNKLIDKEFIDLLNRLLELCAEKGKIETSIEDLANRKNKVKSSAKAIVDEQIKISDDIRLYLDKQAEFYKSNVSKFDEAEMTEICKQLGTKIQQQKINNDTYASLTIQLKMFFKRIEQANKIVQKLNIQIDDVKNLLRSEYQKINWHKIKQEKSACLTISNSIQNNELRKLLNELLKKNFDLEKNIIQLVYKTYELAVIDDNVSKAISLILEINLLIKITEQVYSLIETLEKMTNIDYESIQMLMSMLNLIDLVCNHIQDLSDKKSILRLQGSISNIKSVSELRNATIIKKCRPACLFKEKLRNQEYCFYTLGLLIDNINNYLNQIISEEKAIQKIYL